MIKWIRRVLFTLAIVLTVFIILIAFNYFSIDNRVDLNNSLLQFENVTPIKRLDSITIQPDKLTSEITALLKRANVHGLGISIINDNRLVYQQYFGLRNRQNNESFTPGTIWYGASLSKTIFADIVLQLEEDNVLDLDTPLYRYLKQSLYNYNTNAFQGVLGANQLINYADLEGDERYKKITAQMCLSHTTGLPNWRWLEPDQKLKIKFEPGSKYSYSGEGMFLLQVVIEELTGKDLDELAYEMVFDPQKMTRSSYVWQREYEGNYAVGHSTSGSYLGIPKRNASNAAGSLSTTLEEYTRYFLSVLEQKESRYQTLVSPQISIKSKQQFGPNALIVTDENDAIQLSYGLGFGIYETPYGKAFFKEGHGDGWQHYAVGFPAKGTGLIILSNSDNAESMFKELIEYTMGNPFTPWFWEGYIPFDAK